MVVHDVVCDGCGDPCNDFPIPCNVNREGKDRDKLHRIRHFYKMHGWKVNLKGGKDYCPDCWEKVKHEFRNR